MKQSEAKDFLPIIEAWAEGKTLQFKAYSSDRWVDVSGDDCVAFATDPSRFRIKPEPRKFYAIEYKCGSVAYMCSTKEARDVFNSTGRGKPITLMEVLDD